MGSRWTPVVLTFGLTLSTLTGLMFGLAPAWSASSPDVADTLKQHGARRPPARPGTASADCSSSQRWPRDGPGTAAGRGPDLLIKGFARLRSVALGFNPAG